MADWDGRERRQHNCIQEVAINTISNSIGNIETNIASMATKQNDALTLLLGKDMNGGLVTRVSNLKQSQFRLWWFVGVTASIIIGTAIKVWLIP